MKYSVFQLDAGQHKDGLLNLWEAYLAKNFDGRFEWLYQQNPAGPAKTVVAFTEEGDKELVGCGSLTPRPLYLNGQKILSGIATDFIVHEKHRTYGPALKMQRMNLSELNASEFAIVVAFPNKAGKGPFLRIGCKALGEATLFTKILKSEKKISRYINSPVLAKISGWLFDRGLTIIDKVRMLPRYSRWHTETLHAFDNRFDDLWNQAKGCRIVSDRSSNILNWRYSDNKGVQYRIFCLSRKNNKELKGYVVYFIHNNVANIEDIFTAAMDMTFIDLVHQFSEDLRKKGVTSICVSYFGNDFPKSMLKKLNFREKKTDRQVLIHMSNALPGSDRDMALDPSNWCLFEGDLDL